MTDNDIDPTTNPSQRDRLPPWIIVAVIVLCLMQVQDYRATNQPASAAHSITGHHVSSSTDMNDESLSLLESTDIMAKTAFVAPASTPKSSAQAAPGRKVISSPSPVPVRTQHAAAPAPIPGADPELLKRALDSAETYDADSSNSASAARRVMILRALLGMPPLVKTRKGHLPLDAFGADLPADLLPQDRTAYHAEGKIWASIYGPVPPGGAALPGLVRGIRHLTGLRWWTYPAIATLYNRVHDTRAVSHFQELAGERAVLPVALISLSTGVLVMMLLAGTFLIILIATSAFNRRFGRGSEVAYGQGGANAASAEAQPPTFNPWPVVESAVPNTLKRLRSADLLGVFVLYLITRQVITAAFSGFEGLGHAHFLRFSGLVAPFVHRLTMLPAPVRMNIAVGVESVVYVLSAVPSLVWLVQIARKRGASLGDEIGLHTRFLGKNVMYGVAGYCIAVPLMLLVSLVGRRLLGHFPSPSNPVIPQLVSVTSAGTAAVLIVLASVGAPLVEEILFRGALFHAIRLRTSAWTAIMISGLAFGFMHPVGLAEMFILSVLGCVFAWMAETRKSLAPSMVAHCIQNLSTSVILICLSQ